jgi:glycosyltransferase involved in cell wall biosynthesis
MQNHIKIAQIIDRLNVGGAERVLVILANIFAQNGHQVSVIQTVSAGKLSAQLHPSVNQICLHRKWKWNPLTMLRLSREIRKNDLVHVHSFYNLSYVFLSMKLCLIDRKIFYHEHYGDIQVDQSVSFAERLILPKVYFIAVSKLICDWAINNVRLQAKNVFLLPNIIVQNKTIFNNKAGNDTKGSFLVVSNIRQSKNIQFSIDVLRELRNRGFDVQLTIIGQIVDEHYYLMLQQKMNDCGLSNYISFINNMISIQEQLYKYDLALHVAVSESGPLVLIEYLAQSLPFLTYKTGEVVAQIINDLPELIISSFDVNEWIEKIEEIFQQDSNKLRKKLNTTFDKYFSEEKYYKQCLAIYNMVE